MITEGIRKLTYDERSRWGICPVCGAEHGERCNSNVGIPLGLNAMGHPPAEGAHLGRLQNAPFNVRVTAVR